PVCSGPHHALRGPRMTASLETRPVLLLRVGAQMCALPLEHVLETLRPLPVDAVLEAPHYVRGMAIVRGVTLPVVDLRRLLGIERSTAGRWVTLKAGSRQIALEVDAVIDVRRLPTSTLRPLPPLLARAKPEIADTLAVLDAQLVLVLEVTRLLPEGF